MQSELSPGKTRLLWLSVFLVAVFAVQVVATASAQFADVSASFWAQNYIDFLSDRNVITGYPDNTFRPEKPVTRAEFATMLAKSQNLSTQPIANSAFVDVPGGHWASGAIQSVAARGWIAGYPGNVFRPNQPISMAEMYTIVSKVSDAPDVSASEATRILQQFSDAAQVPNWARTAVATAADQGIYVREITPNQLDPNQSATRAAVATTLAKLVNRDFRTGGVEVGQQVNVTGTLKATARPGEWAVAADGNQYIIANPGQFSGQPWFRIGNQVQLNGRVDTQASTQGRTVVRVNELTATQPQENRVTVTGTLRPSPVNQNTWIVVTNEGDRYRLLNPEQYQGQEWFGYGATVQLSGNVRTDVDVPAEEGTAIVASSLQVASVPQQTTVSGVLKQTTEAGGWFVDVAGSEEQYVLMDIENLRNQSWFRAGTEIEVTGNVRTDIPTIYNEGPVLRVDEITPNPSDIAGAQEVQLYYPNPVNLLRDPVLQLGQPVVRTLEGPNLPQKAVQAILQGPATSETLRGYYLDRRVGELRLDTLNVTNGTARVVLKAPTADFKFENDTLVKNRLDAQLTRTLMQFSGIQNVDVSIEGPNDQVIWTDQDQ